MKRATGCETATFLMDKALSLFRHPYYFSFFQPSSQSADRGDPLPPFHPA